MVRQKRKVLQVRKESVREDDSLLIRSAESLGRVIGSLQRQLQSSSRRMSSIGDDAVSAMPEMPRFDALFGAEPAGTRKKTNGRTASASRKATRASGKQVDAASNGADARKRPPAKTVPSGSAPRSRKRTATRKPSSRQR